jgi:predicted Na+-dependent transporter
VLHSLEVAAQISVVLFVVLSMFSAGLSLSIQQVSEPFKSTRFVISALAANFVLVPVSAYLITRAIPLEKSLAIALLLLGTASGAPLLPKLVEFARGNVALAVGLMALLMTGTIVTMPLVLPLLLPGVHANAWSMAKPLLSVVLPSLAAGFSLRAYRKALAARLQPIFRLASNVALAVVILVGVAYNFSSVVRTGSLNTVVAGTFLFVVWFGIGFALGGPDADARKVLALGTTQRSVSIAFLVAIENLHDSNVVNVLAILTLVALVIQVPAALALGSTHQAPSKDGLTDSRSR